MLYLRWLETWRRHAGRAALYDGGRIVTFAELAALVEAEAAVRGPVIARTGGVNFFVGILRAWRDGQAVIPIEHEAAEPVLKCPPPPDARVVKYTPGASGVPRAIFFNDAQILADADRLFVGMKLSTDMPNLAVISMAHSYGFSNIALQMLLNGVTVCVAAMPFPRVVEDLSREHGPMVVPAVPSIWRAWHRAGILKSLPVKLAVSAGAPLALALEREVFESSGLKIRNFYGASECGGISFDDSVTPRESAEEVGTVLPGVNVSVGGQGRLLVESDAVAIGYDESRSDDLLESGRYLTRDIGFLDGAGKLHLSGNTGGAINVSGRKVSPAKVEAALMATGLLARVRVFGIPSSDPERFEEISAIYEMKAGAMLDALKSATRLETWELPRHWHEDAELWKLSAVELRAMFSRR